ncbi:MAG: 4-hydroxyphenylacetate 3-hydroxylase [Acidimicrobiia bacterium]|nr:4-hydroxyphenylacetate 3-hydroxylase [Acidimicrobiia bacterium]
MPARTGEEYLKGLRATRREIWLGSERVESVVEHPLLAGAAEAIADYYDLHHAHPDDMLMADPESGEPISVSHLLPTSRADLDRRHAALVRIAELSMGVMGRTPDYMNVTFAGFAQDRHRWAGADGSNDEGYENLVGFQRRLRRDDLSLTHTIVNPSIDKATDYTFGDRPVVPLHKVDETADSIVVCGGRTLATLAPFADESAIYPGRPLPPDTPPEYALAFTVRLDSPGLVFLCRDSGTRALPAFDAPFSSRFDEQDGYCIFDHVEIPKRDVWIDADLAAYNRVMFDSPWWSNIMQQTTIRALTKLEFAYALAVRMAEAVNDTAESTTEQLGELQSYIEMTRAALVAGAAEYRTWEDGNVTLNPRYMHPLRSLLPAWFVRVNEVFKEIGGGKMLAAPSRGQLDDPRVAELIETYLPGAKGVTGAERAEIFKLAWDFVGTTFGGRNELYERNYLGSTRLNRLMTQKLYSGPNRERGNQLVDGFLAAARART